MMFADDGKGKIQYNFFNIMVYKRFILCQGETLWEDLLLSFSVPKNTKKILDMSGDENEDTTFSCISGLKAISMLWVIFGHKYAIGFIYATANMTEYFQVSLNFN